ncbi:hypothetical protein BOX15_Mlig006019g1 [Macrostomum lignano]|uniref:SLIT-ROBO Rho GTPase-activating protein 1 n=2 Tax=Macrostomum lignano TaxID=282301 RepID=A0A267FDS7_9PLAT|nr:hypothetical protein BOX15_Mlig006019g1 [Macrostomum lignano]
MLQQINPQLNRSFRNKKDVLIDFESKTKELRVQFTEQLRLMDTRLEWESAVLLELNEFYRRRAEIEEQYSKDLKKLFSSRVEKLHMLERHRSVPGASSYSLFKFYKTVLGITHSQSVNHGVVAKIFSTKMAPRFTDIRENSAKLFQKCKEMCIAGQDEVMENVRQVGQSLRTYQIAYGQAAQAEAKLLAAKDDRRRLEEAGQSGSASGVEKRLKQLDKTVERRREKYDSTKHKALRERNDYLLQLESANACLRKYFSDDMPDILDCMACGFHNSLARAAMMHLNTEDTMKQRQESFVRLFMDTMSQLDAKQDKLHFLQTSQLAFTEPKALKFVAHKGDPINQVCANQSDVLNELESRYNNLQTLIKNTGLESDELWKTLEAAEQSWLSEISVSDYYVNEMFCQAMKESQSGISGDFAADSSQQPEQRNADTDKKRAWENGEFYLGKFAEYMRKNCQLTRSRARAAAISRALGRESGMAPPPLPTKPRKKSIIKVNAQLIGSGKPKLFGGSVDDLQEFPTIVLSCVKLIHQYGLHNQGVFRIPGSQSEVNRLKEAFERGEDPFANATDGRDVNAAAGVLKFYLRGLEEPVLPSRLFDDMLECTKKDSIADTIVRLREIFQQLSPNVYRVLRFLFAFLNHLSSFSDENLMDSYNLSICLAPSFMPVPQGRDPVVFQSSLSHLMKLIIEHESEIFNRKDVSGPVYHKMKDDDFENEDEEDQSLSSEIDLSECNYMVTAKYSFQARTPRELSFSRGDVLTILSRITSEWLHGCNSAGKEGYLPDAYVTRLLPSSSESIEADQVSMSVFSTASTPTASSNLAAVDVDEGAGDAAAASSSPSSISSITAAANTAAAKESPTKSEPTQSSRGLDESDISVSMPAKLNKNTTTSSSSSANATAGGAKAGSEASTESIDQALQDVIAGLESLTYDTESPYANPQELLNAKMHLPASKRAPDLVSDLPNPAQSGEIAEGGATTAADQFALEGHADTLLRAHRPTPPKVGPKPVKLAK